VPGIIQGVGTEYSPGTPGALSQTLPGKIRPQAQPDHHCVFLSREADIIIQLTPAVIGRKDYVRSAFRILTSIVKRVNSFGMPAGHSSDVVFIQRSELRLHFHLTFRPHSILISRPAGTRPNHRGSAVDAFPIICSAGSIQSRTSASWGRFNGTGTEHLPCPLDQGLHSPSGDCARGGTAYNEAA